MGNASKLTANSSVRANVVINLIRTLTMTVLSFITFPYVTRVLGDQVFGLYSWANSFVYYFLILAKISIPNIAIRECVRVKDDPEKFNNTVQKFFILQAATTLLSFAFLCGIIAAVPSLWEERNLVFLLSINFLVGVFSFEWVYIALEKHFYITVRSILLLALGALMTFLFIHPYSTPEWLHNEVYLYALITISSTVLTSLFNCLLLPRYVSLRKTMPYEFKPLLKPIGMLALISLALTLYNQTDEVILGFVDPTKAAVGAYSVGVKGIDIVITLITSLYAVFMPRASYYYAKENKYFYQNLVNYSLNITFFIAVPAIATMATMASPIVYLISGADASSGTYADANWILVALSAMMLTYSIGDNIYTNILLPQKKEKIYCLSMAFGVALNIGLSLLFSLVLWKDRPGLAVAIATGLTDVLVLVFLLILSRDYSKKAVFNANNVKILVAGILVAAASIFLDPWLETLLSNAAWATWQIRLVAMILTVLIDAVLYLGFLALTKERLIGSLLPKKGKKEDNA